MSTCELHCSRLVPNKTSAKTSGKMLRIQKYGIILHSMVLENKIIEQIFSQYDQFAIHTVTLIGLNTAVF